MPTGTRIDPFRTFNFRVEIDGLNVGSFRECSGLTADGTAVEYREGTDVANTVRKLSGLNSYGNVTLRRGYTPNRELWDWYTNIVNGQPDRLYQIALSAKAPHTSEPGPWQPNIDGSEIRYRAKWPGQD